MSDQSYWDKQHDKYLATDWINKPSIFAEWVLQYFPPTGNVLDLGAGQGQDSAFFDATGYTVIATDFSPHALQLAASKLPDDIALQQVDLSQPLPFDDSFFDVVYAHLSLHYFDEVTTGTLFSEIYRVLKPGGILAALCNSDQDPEIVEGKQLEPNFIELDGVHKRYFSAQSAKSFARQFQLIVADDQGTTYKDEAKGVHNLIRLVARKPAG